MANSFNVITVMGRLGKDAEFKDGKNGRYVQFSIAAELGAFNKHTVWFTCRVFRDIGDSFNSLKTGTKLVVTGTLTLDEPKDGKIYPSIMVSNFDWAESSKEKSKEKSNSNTPIEKDQEDDYYDDIPF